MVEPVPSYGEIAVVAAYVTIVLAHIDNSGQSATILCREIAFVECHIFDGIGIEHGEESHDVADVIQRNSIQDDEVFVRPTTPHIQSRRPLRATLHAREQLNGFQHIHLATQGGDTLYLRDGNLDGGHLDPPVVYWCGWRG